MVSSPTAAGSVRSPSPSGGDFDFQEYDGAPLGRRRRRGNRGNGTLVLGLLAFFVIPLLGPVAVMVANGALRDDPDDGSAKAGLVLGWICTGLLLLAFCIIGIVVFAAVGAKNG